MIRSTALRLLDEFEQRIKASGYETASKDAFHRVLSELEYGFSDSRRGMFNDGRLQEVRAIFSQWGKDRIDPSTHAGADTIHGLISKARVLTRHLPETIPAAKPNEAGYFKDLSHLARLTDMRAFVD